MRWFVGLLSAVALAGCGVKSEVTKVAIPPVGAVNAPATSTSVTLEVKKFAEVTAVIKGHAGKVVVMDAWSTSCDPCIKEFPGLVALHKKHGSVKVACISLSCDFEGIGKPEDQLPKVLKFLSEQGATFENFLGREDSDTLFGKLGIPSIPAVFIYGKDGKLAKKFVGEFKYTDVEPIVEELLK